VLLLSFGGRGFYRLITVPSLARVVPLVEALGERELPENVARGKFGK